MLTKVLICKTEVQQRITADLLNGDILIKVYIYSQTSSEWRKLLPQFLLSVIDRDLVGFAYENDLNEKIVKSFHGVYRQVKSNIDIYEIKDEFDRYIFTRHGSIKDAIATQLFSSSNNVSEKKIDYKIIVEKIAIGLKAKIKAGKAKPPSFSNKSSANINKVHNFVKHNTRVSLKKQEIFLFMEIMSNG